MVISAVGICGESGETISRSQRLDKRGNSRQKKPRRSEIEVVVYLRVAHRAYRINDIRIYMMMGCVNAA